MIVLGVDPGTTTGYCIWNNGELQLANQKTPHPFCLEAHELAEWAQTDLTIVCERFTISQRTVKASRAGIHDALNIIGVLWYLSLTYAERDLTYQQPGDAKRLFSDDRLKALGWYHSAMPHANDASRHLGYFLARNGMMPVPV